MASPDRFAEGFSGIMAANVFLILWKGGDLQIPKPISNIVYWLMVVLIFVSTYWAIIGLRDRYGDAAV
jgi:hypothetical protein